MAVDLFEDVPVKKKPPSGRGGARPNSGSKPGVDYSATQDDYEKLKKAQAEKETWLAEQAKLKYHVESGEYVPRPEVRQASATAFAAIAQTLRAIPDNLERRLGIAPEVAEEVGRIIDDALGGLSEDLEKMSERDYQ